MTAATGIPSNQAPPTLPTPTATGTPCPCPSSSAPTVASASSTLPADCCNIDRALATRANRLLAEGHAFSHATEPTHPQPFLSGVRRTSVLSKVEGRTSAFPSEAHNLPPPLKT